MSGLRSYRNLSAPPTVIRAGIPEVFLSGCDRGVKSFHLTPQPCLYMAWSPKSWGTNAEYNIDAKMAPHALGLRVFRIGGRQTHLIRNLLRPPIPIGAEKERELLK